VAVAVSPFGLDAAVLSLELPPHATNPKNIANTNNITNSFFISSTSFYVFTALRGWIAYYLPAKETFGKLPNNNQKCKNQNYLSPKLGNFPSVSKLFQQKWCFKIRSYQNSTRLYKMRS